MGILLKGHFSRHMEAKTSTSTCFESAFHAKQSVEHEGPLNVAKALCESSWTGTGMDLPIQMVLIITKGPRSTVSCRRTLVSEYGLPSYPARTIHTQSMDLLNQGQWKIYIRTVQQGKIADSLLITDFSGVCVSVCVGCVLYVQCVNAADCHYIIHTLITVTQQQHLTTLLTTGAHKVAEQAFKFYNTVSK